MNQRRICYFHQLNPLMQSALRASVVTLEHTPEGWVRTDGRPGCWNSHTIKFLADLKFVMIYENGNRPYCKIRPDGKALLNYHDKWRAA